MARVVKLKHDLNYYKIIVIRCGQSKNAVVACEKRPVKHIMFDTFIYGEHSIIAYN